MSREPTLAYVVGRNAKRARRAADLTLDQVAAAARERGLRWSESRVADFEAGRVAPNLTTLIAVCLALADLGCTDASLPKLISNDTPIEINGSLALWNDDMRNILLGEPVQKPQRRADDAEPHDDMAKGIRPGKEERAVYTLNSRTDLSTLRKVLKASGATEARVCRALDISPMLLATSSAALWGQTFSHERDRRAGRNSKRDAQYRGHVSRQMQAELDAAIKEAASKHAAIKEAANGNDQQLSDR